MVRVCDGYWPKSLPRTKICTFVYPNYKFSDRSCFLNEQVVVPQTRLQHHVFDLDADQYRATSSQTLPALKASMFDN
jgi:hypothetical protein